MDVTINTTITLVLAGGCLGFTVGVLRFIMAHDQRVSHLDAKLSLLLKHSHLQYDQVEGFAELINEALKRGDKFTAIGLYRDSTGATLEEARKHVADLQAKGDLET